MIIEHTDFLFIFNKNFLSNELSFWDNHAILYVNGEKASSIGGFYVDGIIYDRSKDSIKTESLSYNVDNIEDAPLGEYACCSFTEDYAKFFTDPLGAYSIYFYSQNDVSIVSNSFSEIFEYIRKNNYSYTINVDSVLNSAFVGCPFYPCTGINEIELLSPWSYMTINRDGTLTIRDRNNWIFYSNVFEGKITYSDILHWAADRLIKKAKIVAENSEKLIVQVTAGCDSRLVLASLLASGNNKFHIETSGNCLAPDQRFSQLAGDIFGLKHILIRANGVSFNTIRKKNLSLCGVYAPRDRSWEYESPFEFSVMTGAYGELCRGAWTRKVYDQCMRGLEYFSGNISPNIYDFFAWQHFYTEDFKKIYYQKCLSYFKNLHTDIHSIPDLILFYTFSRYHFGQQLKNATRCFCNTFSILNDPIFHALYFSQDLLERINFKSVYDLLMLLYPPLAFMPFEKERVYTRLDEKYLRIRNFINLPEKSYYQPEIIDVRHTFDSENHFDEKEYFDFFQDEKFSPYLSQKSFVRLKTSLKREQVFRKSYHVLCFMKNASTNYI